MNLPEESINGNGNIEINQWLVKLPMPPFIPAGFQEILQTIYFKKDNFADYLSLPETPTDGQLVPLFQHAHLVYGACKRSDEIAIAVLENDKKKLLDLGINPLYIEQTRRDVLERESDIRKRMSRLFGNIRSAEKVVSQNQATVGRISGPLEEVDRVYLKQGKPAPGSSKWDEWARTRIQQFPKGIVVNTDADLTLTLTADHLRLIPASRFLENMIAVEEQNRNWFVIGFSRYSAEALENLPDNFKAIGTMIGLRPGIEDFFRQISGKKEILPTILSANFLPIIEGLASQLPCTNIRIRAVTPTNINSTVKDCEVLRIAIDHPDRAQIIQADGETDWAMLDDRSIKVVVCCLALRGGKFEELAKTKNIPYYPYSDGFDMINIYRGNLGIL